MIAYPTSSMVILSFLNTCLNSTRNAGIDSSRSMAMVFDGVISPGLTIGPSAFAC